MGHKYTFVKVGHIGAQIYIAKVGHIEKVGYIRAQIHICKSGAHWGNGAHWGTNIHS